MPETPRSRHFASAPDWKAAARLVSFRPRRLDAQDGHQLRSLQVHVRDHRDREVPIGDRTLEAHFGAFVFSQSQHSAAEARRRALEVAYGPAATPGRVGGHEARFYELGPEPPPGDPDGRRPAVVTWYEDRMFFLLASSEVPREALLAIARSLYRSRTAPVR
jgi:hypothetical protein